jgi:hypothetical protein
MFLLGSIDNTSIKQTSAIRYGDEAFYCLWEHINRPENS